MWPFRAKRTDVRGRRVVFLIECLLNQNARDLGAAQSPAVTRGVIELLAEKGLGMVQIPCPEILCLGFDRCRAPDVSIREALGAREPAACCARLAAETADRIQCYLEQGCEVTGVLGGNEQSPASAVHKADHEPGGLADSSGIFMSALAKELARRGLRVPLRGMRDADQRLLDQDLAWLRARL